MSQADATSLEGEAPAITGCYKQYEHAITNKTPQSTDPNQVRATTTHWVRPLPSLVSELRVLSRRYLVHLGSLQYAQSRSLMRRSKPLEYVLQWLLIYSLMNFISNWPTGIYKHRVWIGRTFPVKILCTWFTANSIGCSFRAALRKNGGTRPRALTRRRNVC